MDRNDWLDIEPFSIDTDKKDWFNADLTDEQLKGLKKIEKVNAIINRIYYAVLKKTEEYRNEDRNEDRRFDEKCNQREFRGLSEKIKRVERQSICLTIAFVILAISTFFH
jgi:hypothetical protein